MFNSIRSKLILSYLGVAVLTVLLCYGMLAMSASRQLQNLVLEQESAEIETELLAWYARERTWDGFSAYFRELHPSHQVDAQGQQERRPPPPSMHGITDAEFRALTPYFSYAPGDTLPKEIIAQGRPLLLEGEIIAYFIPRDASGVSLSRSEQRYLRDANRNLALGGAVALGLALLIGGLLAQQLVKPVQALTEAAAAINANNLTQHVTVESNDELGQLATTFNAMTDKLAASNQQRRQMTADIAHDLATPLQVISGYIEAIRDGQLQLTPARLETIGTEIAHLQRLVHDLDLLAQTDMQTLQLQLDSVDLSVFLQHTAESFAPLAAAAGITLNADIPVELPRIQADEERLSQVLGNLVKNAVRYTPVGGSVTLLGQSFSDGVSIAVKDTGTGIAEADRPHIFDRFYRADEARTDSGNMGLGLAISKGLVEAMRGKISVASGEPNGTVFMLWFPREE